MRPVDRPESDRSKGGCPLSPTISRATRQLTNAPPQGHSIRASILTTLISLAMAHDDALLILSESPFFIPSLVALLADLSTALWEEEPDLIASPELLSECVY